MLYIIRGHSAFLNVTVWSSSIITNSYWMRQIKKIPNSGKYAIENYDLTIHHVDQHDDGEYTFYVVNVYGTQSIKITLKTGRKPVLTTNQTLLYAKKRSLTVLDVTVSSTSLITGSYWVGQNRIYNSRRYTIDNYDLTVRNVKASDDGEYTFYAKNDYGTQSIKITLKTGRKPVLTTNQTLLYIRRGLAAVLDVTVSSTSLITGSYWVGQNRIYNSRRYTIDNYDLTVRNVKASDDGEYTFYAKNDYGTQSIKITLRTGSTYVMI
ncbi:TTN [Mytilus coruscus]|uniref:TTN n=1 Tax=Mytilus coruscus TaxID=42192 RepID=A0A6J8AJN6_MYTCO|nr:TTN [Mytilus coruscus]